MSETLILSLLVVGALLIAGGLCWLIWYNVEYLPDKSSDEEYDASLARFRAKVPDNPLTDTLTSEQKHTLLGYGYDTYNDIMENLAPYCATLEDLQNAVQQFRRGWWDDGHYRATQTLLKQRERQRIDNDETEGGYLN